jgi:hypothetical protein
MLGDPEVPAQVHLEDIVPKLFAGLERIAIGDNAGVGEDGVEPSHRPRHRAYERFDRCPATYIGQHEHHLATALRCDLSSCAVAVVGAVAAGHNVCSSKGKLPRGG